MRRKVTAVIALTSTACSTWQAQSGPPSIAAENNAANSPVRIELYSGDKYDVYDPHALRDSIVGYARRPEPGEDMSRSSSRVAFASADVKSVAVKKLAKGRTILAVSAIAIVALGVAAGSSTGSGSSGNSGCATSTPTKATATQ